MRPCSSRIGETVADMSTIDPVLMAALRLVVLDASPRRIVSRMFDMSSSRPGTAIIDMWRPIASSGV